MASTWTACGRGSVHLATTTLLLLMIGTLAWHTILGLQVVIEDQGLEVCGLRC